MKILELCLSPDLGGLELYMQRCCTALAAAGDEVLPVVAGGGRLQERLTREGFAPLPLPRRLRALPLLAARRLAGIIDAQGVDVMHLHWGKDLPLAALARFFSRRRPLLAYTRQMQITRPKRDPYHEFLYRQVGLILPITHALAEDMRRLLNPAYRQRVVPLYYGVPAPREQVDADTRRALRRELGVAADTFLVGLFGRIKHYKGQHLLVAAMERLCAEGADAAALIVGHAMEADYLQGLKARVAERGLEQRILFRDFVEQPQRLMQACDCIVLTTVEETFGLVLVEAMRAGVAVIGSDRGGVPEIIAHGETGLLFRSGAADDLYLQLKTLCADPALRTRLAAAGKARADRVFNEAQHFTGLRQLLHAGRFPPDGPSSAA